MPVVCAIEPNEGSEPSFGFVVLTTLWAFVRPVLKSKGDHAMGEVTRRDFFKLCGAVAGSVLLPSDRALIQEIPPFPLHKRIGETTSICTYCGVGCGQIVASTDGMLVNIEGDPDHPINQGHLCPKGNALHQLARVGPGANPHRLQQVKYRAPGSQTWETKSWDWAISEIARRIKATRDANWMVEDAEGFVANRTEAIAALGTVFVNSQEAYVLTKLVRSLGIVFNENESRICVTSAVTAGSESVGRGPMTNHWIDLQNSDCIMSIGCNVAETFPVSFRWIDQAREQGAKLISVDPRFTRTSAAADIYVPLRTGADVGLIGGMINYVLENKLYHEEYVREYTDASFLITPEFGFDDGLFAGWDAEKGIYDKSNWRYQTDEGGIPKRDETLEDDSCVFQLLKKHFSRYDADTVSAITGTPKDIFLEACEAFTATGARDKSGAIICSSGAAQHADGTQNVRSYYILQLLLGNIGVAGGGINGIAGASNGLGCTLQGRLFHVLPGNVPMPVAADENLEGYLERVTPPPAIMENVISPWRSRPTHVVSLLKAWYGDAATEANGFGWEYLPRLGGNYSFIPLFEAMRAGTIKGLLAWGMNPAVSGPSSGAVRAALQGLEWLVVVDLCETETAAIWKSPGVDSAENQTEVFLLPAAASLEKEGSLMNSARWMQWRYQAVDPPGEAKSDLWIINRLVLKLKELYAEEGGPHAEAITDLAWNYGDPPDVHMVAKEMNGCELATGALLAGAGALKDDGTTSCGNWLWCGSYTEQGNMMARRDPVDPSGIGLFSSWAWCFPVNRRIMYNRASVDLEGNCWNPDKPVIGWNPASESWVGDVPDGGPPPGAAYPFVMKTHGRACLFGMGRVDGPFPEHYEPWESPVGNPMSSTQSDPLLKTWEEEKGTPEQYPVLATTYRLVEHMHTGTMTRNVPWLVESQPQMFVELSEELAREKGIANGDRVVIESARGAVEAVAVVTKRLRPFAVNGQVVHQIGLPWHWGYMGLSTGDSANLLTARVADTNTMIPAYREFLVDIGKAV
jgi:formate dehydrogenase-N alpha subunit